MSVISTVPMREIHQRLAKALANNPRVIAFCTEKYGKAPRVMLGLGRNKLKESDCPFIVVFPGQKTEGTVLGQFTYKVSVGWCIYKEAEDTKDGVLYMVGMDEVDEFGEILLSAVFEFSAWFPVCTMEASVEYSVEEYEFAPQFPGTMTVELSVTRLMGTELMY